MIRTKYFVPTMVCCLSLIMGFLSYWLLGPKMFTGVALFVWGDRLMNYFSRENT